MGGEGRGGECEPDEKSDRPFGRSADQSVELAEGFWRLLTLAIS